MELGAPELGAPEPEAKRARTHSDDHFRPWRLLRTVGIPERGNVGTTSLQELVDGGEQTPHWVVLSNYLVDPVWLMSSWPTLKDVPRIVVLQGAGTELPEAHLLPSRTEMVYLTPQYSGDREPQRVKSTFVNHNGNRQSIDYGCMHAKFILIGFRTGIRVVVLTANFIYSDFHCKSNGAYVQDFPYKTSCESAAASEAAPAAPASPFEASLVDYVSSIVNARADGDQYAFAKHALWPGAGAAPLTLRELLAKYDYSRAFGHLVPTCPGFHCKRGAGGVDESVKYGHMRVRALLAAEGPAFPDALANGANATARRVPQSLCHVRPVGACNSDVVCQFSSWANVDANYGRELQASFSTGVSAGGAPLGTAALAFVWPTEDNMRRSVEGYSGGTSLPSAPAKVKSVSKSTEHLRQWNGGTRGARDGGGSAFVRARIAAVPHLKSFTRVSRDGTRAAWSLMTSANISSYALGRAQLVGKPKEHVKCGHWELGVLFTPASLASRFDGGPLFSCRVGSGARAATSAPRAAVVDLTGEAGPPPGQQDPHERARAALAPVASAEERIVRHAQAQGIAFVARLYLSDAAIDARAVEGYLDAMGGDIGAATQRVLAASDAPRDGAKRDAPPRHVELWTTARTDQSPLPTLESGRAVALIPLPFELPLRPYDAGDKFWWCSHGAGEARDLPPDVFGLTTPHNPSFSLFGVDRDGNRQLRRMPASDVTPHGY